MQYFRACSSSQNLVRPGRAGHLCLRLDRRRCACARVGDDDFPSSGNSGRRDAASTSLSLAICLLRLYFPRVSAHNSPHRRDGRDGRGGAGRGRRRRRRRGRVRKKRCKRTIGETAEGLRDVGRARSPSVVIWSFAGEFKLWGLLYPLRNKTSPDVGSCTLVCRSTAVYRNLMKNSRSWEC